MGGFFPTTEQLMRELAEAEQELFNMGFDSMSDAVEEAIVILKAIDVDAVKTQLMEQSCARNISK